MANPFNELRERLLRAGVAPRHVRRYLTELADHLADLRAEEVRAGRSPSDAESAALLRLGGMDDLAKAMIEQRQFQSWCARAPWATFGVAPLLLLAAAYLAACIYLWVLWQVFLPGADTPFGHHGSPGPIYGFRNICFQGGKFFYTGVPILVGWAILLIAARQRVSAVWPIAGCALVALMDSTAQIQASRTAVPNGLGHIRMNFGLPSSAQSIHDHLFYSLILLSLTLLPYLVWRLRRIRSLAA